ncbi:hypothetical protein DNTS_026121, partial [Danionella cerebrum]
FRRKEFRGKLAIAITANFVNRNTTAEAKVEEISGVAFIFNQKFFLELKDETGIDLENIVYYKDNTHYFVMTAKKQSLLDKGVIIHDYIETERLLANENVNQEALLSYAREAADFGTNYQLPSLDYAINHYGQPDVAMFDFTCMYASENAALVRQKHGHQLLVALVGDSLLEPFWPMGTGCARGFLAAFDTSWMIRGWAQGREPVDLLSERESIYRLLPQTTAENISKNFEQYTIDPSTRYPNLNSSCVRPHQNSNALDRSGPPRRSVSISRRESDVRPNRLLQWCQNQTQGYRAVDVTDLTTSWRSGLALDFDSLNEADCVKNNQLAFDVAEREFGIQPITTGKEMDAERGPDKLIMVLYLSKFYEMFRNSSQSITAAPKETDKNREDYSSRDPNSLYNSINLARKRVPKVDKKLEDNDLNRKRKKASSDLEQLISDHSVAPVGEEQKENKVRSMATQLLARFEENASSCALRRQSDCDSSKAVSLDMTDNPRFAKPKTEPTPPVPPPIRPKWQADESSPAVSPSPSKPVPECSTLSCLMSPPPSVQQRQSSESLEMEPKLNKHTELAHCDVKRVERLDPSVQRTVGKVSSTIGVKAATLAILYETDHRPNNPFTLSLTEARRSAESGVKRVYIMERLSAEGFFFHRECFRCHICSCTLRLGAHAFDSQQGTFYCKMHFSQGKLSGRYRRGETNGSSGFRSSISPDCSSSDRLHVQPSAGAECGSALVSRKPVTTADRAEVPKLSDSTELILISEVQDSAVERAQADSESVCPHSPQQKVKHSTAKGEITSKNNLWKKKIRSILMKFHRGKAEDKTDALTEEGDSDFEEINQSLSPKSPPPPIPPCEETLLQNETLALPTEIPKIPLYRPHILPDLPKASTSSPDPATIASTSEPNALSPKKKLTLSSSEKEELLTWDLTLPGSSSSSQAKEQARSLQPPQDDQPEPETPINPQDESPHAPFGFQQWASSFRKSLSRGNNPVVIKRKARPLSEGSFSLSKLFNSTSSLHCDRDEEHTATSHDEVESRNRTGSDITALLEKVALGSRPSRGSKDDMASIPARKLNFFSSLRVKRREEHQSGGENQKDILSILSRFRSKEMDQQHQKQQQQQHESSCSSEEEQESDTAQTISGTSQKKQEKMSIRQTKRDELKRLHRAQVIQRQLEEVEEKQRALEERGVILEKILRHENGDDSTDEAESLQTWFKLVLEKNKLSRYESELMIFAQELELEDTQSRLQRELRQRMATEDCEKSASELAEEQSLLQEIMKAVEDRDRLVSLLEEQRLKEKAEDRDLESLILARGYHFHWN